MFWKKRKKKENILRTKKGLLSESSIPGGKKKITEATTKIKLPIVKNASRLQID